MANQARLEYYEGATQRMKYDANGSSWWWEASPSAGSAAVFAGVGSGGNAYDDFASAVGGCAPAFCVR